MDDAEQSHAESRGPVPIRDRPGLFWFELRRWVRNRSRLVSERSGEFTHGEISERSRQLDDLWDTTWAGVSPAGHILRRTHPSRSVRLHSLPGGKRYADTEAEHAEVVRRHRTVLADLLGDATNETLVVLATDYGRRDLMTGWTRSALPDAWPWRRFSGSVDEDEAPSFVWVQTGVTESHLDTLLRLIADDGGSLVLAGPQVDWVYCPYDGGVDVILPGADERDLLASRYADWLPQDQT